MSASTRCWHCGKKLVGLNGQPKPPLIFAVVLDQMCNEVRVHKVCVANAGRPVVTAQPSNSGVHPDTDDVQW